MKEAVLPTRNVSDLCTDIFLATLRIQTTREVGSFDSLHPSVQKLFESFEQKAKAIGMDPAEIGRAHV